MHNKPIIIDLPDLYSDCGFNNYAVDHNKDLIEYKNRCLDFVKNDTGKRSLFLYGNVGAGKTHLAISVMRNLKPKFDLQQNKFIPLTCKFVSAPEFFIELNDSFIHKKSKLQLIIDLLQFDYVCIDDLGAENLTEAKKENLYILVNRAYLYNRNLIITSNMSVMEWGEIDERIASRIIQKSAIVNMQAEDFRTLGIKVEKPQNKVINEVKREQETWKGFGTKVIDFLNKN